MTVTVLYSCVLCGLKRTPVPVPARENEDVLAWMNATVLHIAADHQARSPECPATEITEVMVPMTGADRVGGPALQ